MEKNQEKKLEALQKGYNKCWDIFFNGDEKSGTKPGNIYVYGAIVGQREIAKEILNPKEISPEK